MAKKSKFTQACTLLWVTLWIPVFSVSQQFSQQPTKIAVNHPLHVDFCQLNGRKQVSELRCCSHTVLKSLFICFKTRKYSNSTECRLSRVSATSSNTDFDPHSISFINPPMLSGITETTLCVFEVSQKLSTLTTTPSPLASLLADDASIFGMQPGHRLQDGTFP